MNKPRTIVVVLIDTILSLPFLSFHPLLPFIVILVLYGGGFVLARQFSWRLKSIHVGMLGALICFIPISCLSWLDEQGLAMGPFSAHPFVGSLTEIARSDSVQYGSGKLVSYAHSETNNPILAYIDNGQVRWASEFGKSSVQIDELVEMKVEKGILRDRIAFFATGHLEPGWAFIWKLGGVQKYYVKAF